MKDKIKKIIASDAWWYIGRVFWFALPIGIIISRCNIFEAFLCLIGSIFAVNVSHDVISQEISNALDRGHIDIRPHIILNFTDQTVDVENGKFTQTQK